MWVRKFLSDETPDKRDKLIDSLVEPERYAFSEEDPFVDKWTYWFSDLYGNNSGQLGIDNNGFTINVPGAVPNLAEVMAIATGQAHVLALKTDGTVAVFGDNFNGQLGNGASGSSHVPSTRMGAQRQLTRISIACTRATVMAPGDRITMALNLLGPGVSLKVRSHL